MYAVFMIDPPWPKKKGGLRSVRPKQSRSLDYPTMGVEDIFALLDRDVFAYAATLHTVFIWTVDQFLRSCEQEMESRDYRRHARLIWDKTNGVAPAFSVRYSHEYLLWYYKPKFTPVDKAVRGVYRTVFTEVSREHSRKPDTAYHMVETMFPASAKLDVFSREKRDGWDQYGDQPDYFGGGPNYPQEAKSHLPLLRNDR